MKHSKILVVGGHLAGLVFALVLCSADTTLAGPEAEAQLRIVLEDGRLSVDLENADIRQVLAEIGAKTGIRFVVDPLAARPITSSFRAMDVEPALRRLLNLAALDYTIVYDGDPERPIQVAEVHAREGSRLGGTRGISAPALSPPWPPARGPDAVRRSRESAAPGSDTEPARRFREALERRRQPADTAPAESDTARRFREALERTREPAATAPAESDAARQFREALERTRQPAETPLAESDAARAFREALERNRRR